jgi:hypothetical protein
VLERTAACVGIAIFVITAAVASCSQKTGETPDVPDVPDARDTGGADVTFAIDSSRDTSFAFDDAANADTSVPRADPPDAGPLPMLPCGDSGEDTTPPWGADETSTACPLPPSYCIDDRWLASYINGTCEDGGCRYWRVYQDCKVIGASWCTSGRCLTAVGK